MNSINPSRPKEVVAVVDVGSNTTKLLVARRCKKNEIEVLHEKSLHARLGGGIVNGTCFLSEDSMVVAEHAILGLLEEAFRFSPLKVRLVATGAVRFASNGDDFAVRVENATKYPLNVLSGQQEAEGIAVGLGTDPEISGREEFIACDIGGGSLELIHFDQGSLRKIDSLPLGAIRLTQKHVADPRSKLNKAEVRAIVRDVEDSLRQSDFSSTKPCEVIVATGGAFVAIRAILAHREGIAFDQLNLIDRSEIELLSEAMSSLSLEDRVKSFPSLPANRADIMPAALHCIFCIMNHFEGQKILNSLRNLRYGQAAKLLGIAE
tara:strand:- start:534 stop:1496 length:963 start_codon:yes stop_codon:yes gene_type:complete